MELNQIRYFLEVAQTQHVSRSAEHLHIAQPALSQSIHRLEKDLGVPLFVAKGRNIVLTEYGKYLQKKLIPIIEELDAIPSRLQTMAKLENDTIHLNVLAASALITEAIIEYQKKYHHLNFQFTQNNESRLYDIGITTRLFYQLPEEQLQNVFLCTEKIFLAVPRSSPYALRSEIDLQEVADEGFISLMGSRQLRWICDRFCQHAGFRPRIVFESDSPAAVKNMIAANMGIGFWPEFTWGQLETDRVVLLDIRQPICRREILFDCKHNKIEHTAVDDFFEFLKSYCQAAKNKAQLAR